MRRGAKQVVSDVGKDAGRVGGSRRERAELQRERRKQRQQNALIRESRRLMRETKKSLERLFVFFFFNDPATTQLYTLSLHDALPICHCQGFGNFSLARS